MSRKRFASIVVVLALLLTAAQSVQGQPVTSAVAFPAGDSLRSVTSQDTVNSSAPVNPSSSTSWRYAIPSNFIQPVIAYDVYDEIGWEFGHLSAPGSVRDAIPSNFIQPIETAETLAY